MIRKSATHWKCTTLHGPFVTLTDGPLYISIFIVVFRTLSAYPVSNYLHILCMCEYLDYNIFQFYTFITLTSANNDNYAIYNLLWIDAVSLFFYIYINTYHCSIFVFNYILYKSIYIYNNMKHVLLVTLIHLFLLWLMRFRPNWHQIGHKAYHVPKVRKFYVEKVHLC